MQKHYLQDMKIKWRLLQLIFPLPLLRFLHLLFLLKNYTRTTIHPQMGLPTPRKSFFHKSSSPNPSSEKTLMLLSANAFKLVDKEWKTLDNGQGSKIAVVENAEGRFRVVAFSASCEVLFREFQYHWFLFQYVINAWIRSDREPKRSPNENFFTFPTVVNKANVQYGLNLLTKEEADQFHEVLNTCVQKLKAMPTKHTSESKEEVDQPH